MDLFNKSRSNINYFPSYFQPVISNCQANTSIINTICYDDSSIINRNTIKDLLFIKNIEIRAHNTTID